MTRILIGFATVTLALAGCYPGAQAPVTTTSVTIPPATKAMPATPATPNVAPEPRHSASVESSGISFDLQTDSGTTADGRISDAIYAGILADPKLGIAAQEIDVTTREGNVVLTGRVHNDTERTAIEERARNTAGVKNVDDRLEVMP